MRKTLSMALSSLVCYSLLLVWAIDVEQPRKSNGKHRIQLTSADASRAPGVLLRRPDPQLTPREVVAIQLTALKSPGKEDQGITTCFEFASPSNRQSTGPLPRFLKMVKSPPYGTLVEHHSARVLHVETDGARSLVLVHLIDRQMQPGAFLFALSKQNEDPYKDCWMTDSVVPVPVPPSRRPPPVEA